MSDTAPDIFAMLAEGMAKQGVVPDRALGAERVFVPYETTIPDPRNDPFVKCMMAALGYDGNAEKEDHHD